MLSKNTTHLAAACSAMFVNTPTYLVSTSSLTFAVHHGSSGSVKSLVDLENFDLEEDLLWSDSVATIGQPRTPPQVGGVDWLSIGKTVTKEIPFCVRHCCFCSFRVALLYFTENVRKIRERQAAVWYETDV